MEGLASNIEIVQYHIWRNEEVFVTNNFDGTGQKGQYKRLLVHWFHNFHTHFPHTISRNHFESIWQGWHFSDNSQQTQDKGGLFKIWHRYEYFVMNFRSVYSPKQDLSLDDAMTPWWGHLKFRTYNPGKITNMKCWCEWCVKQYQVLSATWRYTQLRKKLEDTILSL